MGKVVSQGELILQRREWKRNGRRVVFASGAFDLLHPGHIRLLEQARSLGDILIVAVQSDASVRSAPATPNNSSKNSLPRPITPGAERAEILAALAAVDFVVEFDQPSPRNLIAQIAPDVLVHGGAGARDAAAIRDDKEAESAGAKIVRIPLEPGYSTSRLLDRIKQLRA
ncbi:MAG: adenylyltransferase/cytidyltransferase family protein [Candidatus Acidiferrales bacterium]